MLAQQNQSPSHGAEDQSSPDVFAPRITHWANTLVGLLGAARTVAENYLQAERADPKACVDLDHYKAVCGLFDAIEQAGMLGLTLNGALQLAGDSAVPLQLWFANTDRFSAASKRAVIAANAWLKPGDVVYQAQTILRHTVTEEDLAAARAPLIGGMQ
jgi:hypothetical protein